MRASAPTLFRQQRDRIDGVLVTLPNFGDERAVANTLRWSGLDVPVLVHAFPDDAQQDDDCRPARLVLWQDVGVQQPAPVRHQVQPDRDCTRSTRRARVSGPTCAALWARAGSCAACATSAVGVVGARPAAFNTVRFSEKLLERAGISVETLDLSEVIGAR